MVKLNTFIAIVYMLTVGLCSCGEDETTPNTIEDPSKLLIGTWKWTDSETGDCTEQTFMFKADMTGEESGNCPGDGYSFTWSADADKLTINIGSDPWVTTYSISGNNLTITEDGSSTVFIKQ